jgi:hypothetical protein
MFVHLPRAPDVKRLLDDPQVRDYAYKTLSDTFTLQGVNGHEADNLADQILQLATALPSIESYESESHRLLQEKGFFQTAPRGLPLRERIIHGQIIDHILGSVIDVGCGDGLVGSLVADSGHPVADRKSVV